MKNEENMKNEEINKINVVINDVMINKLKSIDFDIKYYMNINASIGQLDEEIINSLKFMDDEEIKELIEIRLSIKKLAHKLKNKLDSK